MSALVKAIESYSGWLYALLGLLIARDLYTMWTAGREREQSLFGLEREAATGKAVRAFVTLLLLVTIGVGIYTVDTVIAPTIADDGRQSSAPIVETPQVVPLPSMTPSPPPVTPTPTRGPVRIVTATPHGPGSPTEPSVAGGLCRNPNVVLLSPDPGAVLIGDTPLEGTVRFPPDAGFTYRLEIGAGASPTAWAPVGEPLGTPVVGGTIAVLDIGGLGAGLYTLRLSLSGPDGQVAEGDACAVTVRVP